MSWVTPLDVQCKILVLKTKPVENVSNALCLHSSRIWIIFIIKKNIGIKKFLNYFMTKITYIILFYNFKNLNGPKNRHIFFKQNHFFFPLTFNRKAVRAPWNTEQFKITKDILQWSLWLQTLLAGKLREVDWFQLPAHRDIIQSNSRWISSL